MQRPAPWPDFAGQQINHGDRLTHPDGTEFVAVRLNGFDDEGDAWRAIYENPPSISRLCLQIGNKGRAVLSDRSRGLYALAERVARLNPAAGEIGAGMLASLVEQARNLTNSTSST